MAKKLEISAVVCDLRDVQEETLAAYESIRIEAALALVNARARALLARYPVHLECAATLDREENVKPCLLNGKVSITGANAPHDKLYLMANGVVTVTPDAGDALRQYIGGVINGVICCPRSLTGVLAGNFTVNGKLYAYPDEAVVLKSTTVLDHTFLLRAQPRLYWAAKQFIAVDPRLDGAALAARGVRFSSQKAILCEGLAQTLAPLFDEGTELILVPDGTSVIQDDLKLTAAALRRYGGRLFVTGDLEVDPSCQGLLDQIDYLRVAGDVTLPEALAEEFYGIENAEYGEVISVKGRRVQGQSHFVVDRALLDGCPDGLTLSGCGHVALSSELEPADILEHLQFSGCAHVSCTAAQHSAVAAVSSGVAHIDPIDGQAPDQPEDVQTIEAVQYAL